MRIAIGLVVLAACNTGSSVLDHDASSTSDAYTQTLQNGPCSVDGITGTIAGVSISIHADSCVIKRGTGQTFTYEVTTTASVPAITTPDSGGGCGACRNWSADPLTFIGYYIDAQAPSSETHYCECDVGCCAPTQARSVQVDATTATDSLVWSGRSWDGASDTGNPMGDFFPYGLYSVRVTFSGFDAGQVVASLPIEIVP